MVTRTLEEYRRGQSGRPSVQRSDPDRFTDPWPLGDPEPAASTDPGDAPPAPPGPKAPAGPKAPPAPSRRKSRWGLAADSAAAVPGVTYAATKGLFSGKGGGTLPGLMLGLFLGYPLVMNLARGGPGLAWTWVKAKFVNRPGTPPGATVQ